jgi:HEAT repeat protein
MPREQIRALADDVGRLLAAGAATAPGDEKLRRRERALRELGQKVPVLAKVADAVRRVIEADTTQAAAPLLDLLSIVRQVRAGLTTVGVEGELTPIESVGAWASETPARDLYPIIECLARTGRREIVAEAVRRGIVADLRLVGPLLGGLGDGYGELAERIAEEALPAFGPALLPTLRRALDLKGKAADARRLIAICKIDVRLGAELCRRALDEGSPALQVQALKCYPWVDSAEAERAALALLARGVLPGIRAGAGESDDGGPATKVLSREVSRPVRAAALAALAGSRTAAALEALIAAAPDHAEVWLVASSVLAALPHPDVVGRLVGELEAIAPVPGAGPAGAKTKGKGRVKAAAGTEEGTPATERACRLVDVLARRRGDRRAVEALIALLGHPASDLREAAVNALAALEDPQGLEAAAALVDDLKVWRAAIQAAWKLPPAARFDRLAPLLADLSATKKPTDRAKWLLTLFERETVGARPREDWDPRWADALRAHLDGASRPGVAIALEVVLRSGAVAELLRVLVPSVGKDECGVVEALGRLRAREAIAPLLALMPGQPPNHYCIHDALRRIGDPSIVPALKAMLGKTKDRTKQARLNQLIVYLETRATT